MGRKRVEGTCAWCKQIKMLCRSHIIADFWGRAARKADPVGYKLNGYVVRLEQSGFTEPLLCEVCEGTFAKTEEKVAKNWKDMQERRREVLRPNRNWRRMTGWDDEQQARRKKMGREKLPERWTGVNGTAWRQLAVITAWRSAATKWGLLDEIEGDLRRMVETGMYGGQHVPLLITRLDGGCPGLEPGSLAVQTVESPPRWTWSKDIEMAQGGLSLTLAMSQVNQHVIGGTETRRAPELERDVKDDGTWIVTETDMMKGEWKERCVDLLIRGEGVRRRNKARKERARKRRLR